MEFLSRKLKVLAISCFILSFAHAQDFAHFKPLKSEGTIPKEFLLLSSEKYNQSMEALSKSANDDKRYERKAKKEFSLKNSFEMKDFLFSGRVIFNDPISNYVNKVAAEILKTEPELQGKVKFYTIRTADVNAFATHEGLIFVNEGMIAQLENEAQLAFLLCHEIVHYKKQHVLNSYVEGVRISKGKTGYRSLSEDKKYWAENRYSRELETEADISGLEIFLKTGYSVKSLERFFDVLQYSYLPYDDIAFKKSFLETETFRFPDSYFLEKVKPIASKDEENEEKSTHPSIKNRRAYIAEKAKRQANRIADRNFIVSEKEFYTVRKIARYDITAVCLLDQEYVEAFYNSYLLLQEDSSNLYAKKGIAKSLYGLTKYANEGRMHEVTENYNTIEGNSQQVYHLFDKLKVNELNAVALKYCWQLSQRYPAEADLKAYTDDLFKSMVFQHYRSSTLFQSTPFVPMKPSANVEDTRSKYDKIQSVQDSALTDQNFIKYVFVDELMQAEFQLKFDALASEKMAKDLEKDDPKTARRKRKEKAKEETRVRRKGHALGIDKVVVYNPFYMKVDQRKRRQQKYLSAENAEFRLSDRIRENAAIAKLDVELLNDLDLKETDLQKYNDMTFMTLWLQERVKHMENGVKMHNLDYEYAEDLAKRYNTKYFSWMGVIGMRQKKYGTASLIVTAVFVPYMIPYTVYYIVTPKYDSYYIQVLFDIKTGESKLVQSNYIDDKDSRTVINMSIYDSFYQMKTSRNK